jgi:hypothetical protein
MEDRVTPFLWLERAELGPEGYAARAHEVAGRPGVDRATWWVNVVPGRTDLPRRIDEFTTLGVYEVDGAAFVPPDDHGYLFRGYPRPGQGRLTGLPTIGLSLVLISPKVEEDAQPLRDWADFVHINHIAAVGVPGFTMITPYERVGGGTPRFLHFYEMDTEDPEAAFKLMPRLVEDRLGRAGTPAFDHWAWHPALRIDYVNTFRLVGEVGG